MRISCVFQEYCAYLQCILRISCVSLAYLASPEMIRKIRMSCIMRILRISCVSHAYLMRILRTHSKVYAGYA